MKITLFLLAGVLAMQVAARNPQMKQPEFSTAGFFAVENTGREVYSMNPAWRFHKGEQTGAYAKEWNDEMWEVVSLPHGIEYLPAEASGCVNYQGVVWYRKHFTPQADLQGKKLFLHFEAIMGKSKIYLNGKLLKEQYGGFLPVVVDITQDIEWETDNVIAVWTDNSDDPAYPPGKAQEVLDFAYFGGIYRDCWLVAHRDVYITDPNYEKVTAGGGLFVAYDNVAEDKADVLLKLHVKNQSSRSFSGQIEYVLQQMDGSPVATLQQKIAVGKGKAVSTSGKIRLKDPVLWSPSAPNLYNLFVYIKDNKGQIVDGYRRRIGIRSIEFKGEEGFWLNGKPYGKPLMGANRHQDFAVIGNALPNSLHWRDAKKLKDVGLEVIRNAHYPQDPSFMDACDELGLFVIVNTPGWQFWNEDPIFGERVYSDIRNMIRRDRNHTSVWLWEPILNETWYPDDFAKNVLDIVYQEYPYPYCYAGCDSEARGHAYYPVLFTHPFNGNEASAIKKPDPSKTYFTREWGDNVDDWNSHNSPSRVARNWGEQPMLIQAQHYASPCYTYTCYDALYQTSPHHVGGSLWHSFDHQRGYHPDPFYGGIMDAFRQPKYSYYMFMAQRPVEPAERIAETGPMVYIAHEMTPFSGKDVVVYSNCQEVRLTVHKEGKSFLYRKDPERKGMPSPVIVFPDVFDVMEDKKLSRERKQDHVFLLAEGMIDGKVVATHKVEPARRPEKILLWVDDEETGLQADGSDIVTVVAAIADKKGNIKHLNNSFIRFEIEGEGRLFAGNDIMRNPAPVAWGTAPVLVQSTMKPGKIRVTAEVLLEGIHVPVRATLELESKPSSQTLIYSPSEAARIPQVVQTSSGREASSAASQAEIDRLKRELNAYKLKEVEQQQEDFGEKK
ncbi:glycoside hydrolase family 2 protein [Parabacteroides sp. OttesenSCG-928-G06]|nr:glycoside hydrolase family 2 protein [Parabacteroides sp. OttesenSCG-928-G06]